MSRERPAVSREKAENYRAQVANGKRIRRSFYVTEAMGKRLNDAVHAVKGRNSPDGEFVPDSASALVEMAVWAEIARLEDRFNDGESFPPAAGPLPSGPAASGVDRLSRPRGPYYPD